ncbi:hypothetical protein [Zobellia galactanivorans]|uniref:hypothetical protein n=1 Tax=Zobellia galactanivorans (strain DSM 12802 / CCUG 47099 / CIP 106680 / NCIMB 13871 / Dsij) TaxID=63186 RepID=UPI001C0749AD|nr:hypothetical protein [Zobellia galactanivorans]MBU3027793.1 hypothetical protein [Zobellia galactanivorans]
MRICLILILVLAPQFILHGQNEPKSYLEFSFGLSRHGTGDITGYHFGTNYGKEFSNKFYWQLGFEGTLNDSPYTPLFYELSDGERVDATLHTVTAGFQLVTGIRYNFIQTTNQRFGLSILPLFRYQATSLMDLDSVLYPAGTDLPYPVRSSIRFSPARTFAVGASLRLNYYFQIGDSFYLGLLGAVQFDSNSDTIPHFGLVFGKRL